MSDELFREKILWTIIIVLVGLLGGNIIYGLSMWRNLSEPISFFLSILPLGVILVFRHRLIMRWTPSELATQLIMKEKENKELLKSQTSPL